MQICFFHVTAALQHCCVKRIADGVEAFGKGFNQYNLLTFLKAQPEAAKDIFCQKIEKIYSKEMLLYQFHISNDDRKTQVYKFLVTYLEKAEGKFFVQCKQCKCFVQFFVQL